MVRTRNIKKQHWLTREEASTLKKKAKKVGMNESTFMRNLIMGFEPKEKPDERFYDYLRYLYSISNSLNQIARKLNSLGFLDEPSLRKSINELNDFIIKITDKYLEPQVSRVV